MSYETEDYSLEHPETRILFLGLRVSMKTFTCWEECVPCLGFAENEEMMFFSCSRSTGSWAVAFSVRGINRYLSRMTVWLWISSSQDEEWM